ncbi:methyl-accepting chemotaxis protein [Fusibacter sp. JL298sf-3]
MKIKMSFRTKLILTFVLVIAVPIAVLGGVVYKLTYDGYYDNLKSTSEQVSAQINTGIKNYMNIYGQATELLSKDPNVENAKSDVSSREWLYKSFEAFIEQYDVVRNVYVGYDDLSFYIHPTVDLPSDYDPTIRPWYIKASEENRQIWTDPYEDATEGNPLVISAASPVYNGSNFQGVVAIDLDISEISRVANGVTIGENGYIVLFDSNNVTFTHPNPDNVGKDIPIPELKAFVENNASGVFEYTYEGEKRIALLSTIEGLDWKILATVDENEIFAQTRSLLFNILLIGVVLILIAVAIAVVFSNAMLKNIKNVSTAITHMSEGDLSQTVHVHTKDEFGKLADDLNHMIASISGLIGNVHHATQNVLSSSNDLVGLSDRASIAAREVSGAVEEVATGATRQAQDSENSSRVAKEMGQNIKTLTDSVFNMIGMTKKATEINSSSQAAVMTLKEKNTENNDATEKTEEAILDLERQSLTIGDFVQTISTIAEQTNLLALNASIEAARAGEHGRGFAVVADEIRKLAEESSKAADEIKNIVLTIQKGSKNTVTIMQEVKSRSHEQNDAVERVENAFSDIFNAINGIQNVIDTVSGDIEVLDVSKVEILDSITSIASVSEEAAAASEEVSASMEEQTAVVEQVAIAADQLKGLADELEANINKFKI